MDALGIASSVLTFVDAAAKITFRYNFTQDNVTLQESRKLVAAINNLTDTLADSDDPINDEFVAVRVEAKALAHEMLQLSDRIHRLRALAWRWPSLTRLFIPLMSAKKISQLNERCRKLVSFTQLWM